MNIYKKYLAIALFGSFLLFFACNSADKKNESKDNKKQSQVDYMHKEVIRIHDEIMPQMKDISLLQKDISFKIDSLSELEEKPEEVIETLKMRKLGLDACASSMMKWMKNYREPKKEMEEAEAMEYLKKEKKKIEEIANDFDKKIKDNKEYLRNF